MRKLTEQDFERVVGMTISDYKVLKARAKLGNFSDTDHYGILLARNEKTGMYVTWQYHHGDNDEVDAYWGFYTESEAAALRDFEVRDKALTEYRVEITETLCLAVDCKAESPEEAEGIVRAKYNAGEYVLGAEHFKELEINAYEKGADD